MDNVNSDSEDEDDNAIKKVKFKKLVGSSPEVQDFMNKVTRIIVLFLGDSTAPKELHRSVLKFTKIAITYLNFEAQPDLLGIMLTNCFGLKKPQVFSTLIRRIVSKLMFKCTVKSVKAAITNKAHLALVAHIDREKRKKRNAGEKRRMIQEIGKGSIGADKAT